MERECVLHEVKRGGRKDEKGTRKGREKGQR